MNGILELVNRLGPQRLVAMGAVTLALVGFFAFVMTKMSGPNMGVLFSDLPVQDSNAIVRDLENRGVRYELRGDGTTILVPRDQTTRLRMEFAGKGMPAGGTVGYEIFDKSDSFSATSLVQGVNQLRALEGELSRTIRSIERVQQARVHLAIPEKRLFERDRQEPRASIVLKVRGELEPGQIRAVRHLVATAVQGLKPERVSIVDETGRLLADGAGNETDAAALAADKQSNHERRLRSQVEDIVASIVGRGRARVQVAAEMDFNRVQQVTDSFDPESRVIRSTQTRTENQQSQESRDNQVTIGNELPQQQQQNAPANPQQRDATQRNEEIVNYEITKTTRTEIIEAGRVKRLSVAVLVDGIYTPGANGQMSYQPRPAEELERIAALVRSSIGFDRNRGDQVDVINLRFAEGVAAVEGRTPTFTEQMLALTKEDVLRMVEIGVFGLLTLLVTLLVVRPLLRQMGIGGKGRSDSSLVAVPQIGGLQSVIDASGMVPGATGPAGQPLALPAPGQAGTMVAANSNQANVNTIQHALQQGAIDSLGRIVQENPSESVAIVRQWIAQTR
ncbi:flagellar basal-body MS-ring/collar protein FliF [Rhabdaerophilum sp. SD176]|uniref:flagellar basal-body MS-ring/collar protein FliF n=1 Tax=Rhabdaerophilum sp. SD176 TaxID=2983548 RepID=UPI0024DFEBA0|nr:flagellar basal-body MS-ring/collar protein FliF [Rhabdaerophilum sp. SD176]